MIAALALALVVIAAEGTGSTSTALEKCRALDKEFDTKNMPKPCQAAADDTTLGIPERVEALRRLAFAHILNGDEALGEPAFMKMLVLSPTAELPGDAGPRFREVFASVKKRFDEEGKLIVTFVPPPQPAPGVPVELQVDIADKLGRVVGARVKTKRAVTDAPLEDRLVRNELSPGNLRFTGRVPEPPLPPEGGTYTYEVVVETWDGQALALPTPITGEIVRAGGGAVAPAEPGGEGPPWVIIGAIAGGVVVAGAVTGGIVWCFTAGSCRNQEAWVRVQIQQGATE